MKENKYDDPAFFEAYSHFPRSVEGLPAAGEWEAFQRMLPGLDGKRVLDLGCGFGWHCRYAAEHGAAKVTGCDISQKMLAVAREKTDSENISYIQTAIEDVDFPDASFDVAISSLAFHYVEDFGAVCAKVYRLLDSGGDFVFSVEHPIFTAQGVQDWYYDEDGKPLHWPVDNYFFQGKRETVFLGEKVVKYHRTLTTYVGDLLEAGFVLTSLVEPQPPERLMGKMTQELRRPMMLLLAAHKP
jgi:SAM-dependent methyltransferase